MRYVIAFLRGLMAWVIAAIGAYTLGSILNTQFVIGAHDISVPFADRLNMTTFDLSNMYLYWVIILVAFLIGFSVAWIVKRFLPRLSAYAYPIAGGAAIGLALGLMYIQFQTIPISGARSLLGYCAQILAGAFGGWIFAKIISRKKPTSKPQAA